MRRSRNFRQGVQVNLTKKAGVQVNLTKKALTFFFLFFFMFFFMFFFFSPQLIYGFMVNFKENYHLSRFRRGSNIFQGGGGGWGGGNFFQGGGPIAYSL